MKLFFKLLLEGVKGACAEDCVPYRRHKGCWRQYGNSAVEVLSNRKPITTTRGYAGLASADVEEGDIICILFGGKVPYALRRKDGYYRFLGECYVHGIMDGEAMDMLADGQFEKTTFDIR